jgi:hypothetical protein
MKAPLAKFFPNRFSVAWTRRQESAYLKEIADNRLNAEQPKPEEVAANLMIEFEAENIQ